MERLRRCDNITSIVECLRESSQLGFRLATNAVAESYHLGPTLDDFFIPDLPSKLIAQGKFAKVPIMVGHATDDGFLRTKRKGSPADPILFGNTTARFWAPLHDGEGTRLANLTAEAQTAVEGQYAAPEDSDGEFAVRSIFFCFY